MHIYAPHMYRDHRDLERAWIPWNWSHRWLWAIKCEPNPGPVEEQPELLTTKSSPQSQREFFIPGNLPYSKKTTTQTKRNSISALSFSPKLCAQVKGSQTFLLDYSIIRNNHIHWECWYFRETPRCPNTFRQRLMSHKGFSWVGEKENGKVREPSLWFWFMSLASWEAGISA